MLHATHENYLPFELFLSTLDAWLEKQLASGVSIGDGDDADVDVTDWEKELQNELKDYVEGS